MDIKEYIAEWDMPSKDTMEFMRKFHRLCSSYGLYTHDDEWAPECYFMPFVKSDPGVSFDVLTDGGLVFRYFVYTEHSPLGKLAKQLFEDEVNEHLGHEVTTIYYPRYPIFGVALAISDCGNIHVVARIWNLFNKEGDITTYEKDLGELPEENKYE